MSAKELATKIVEAILAQVDSHLRQYGPASFDEDAKREAIARVTRMIEEDRNYF